MEESAPLADTAGTTKPLVIRVAPMQEALGSSDKTSQQSIVQAVEGAECITIADTKPTLVQEGHSRPYTSQQIDIPYPTSGARDPPLTLTSSESKAEPGFYSDSKQDPNSHQKVVLAPPPARNDIILKAEPPASFVSTAEATDQATSFGSEAARSTEVSRTPIAQGPVSPAPAPAPAPPSLHVNKAPHKPVAPSQASNEADFADDDDRRVEVELGDRPSVGRRESQPGSQRLSTMKSFPKVIHAPLTFERVSPRYLLPQGSWRRQASDSGAALEPDGTIRTSSRTRSSADGRKT